MTRQSLMRLLESEAKLYCKPRYKHEVRSVIRNKHMNDLTGKERISQKVIDAIVVDFVNHIGTGQGLDLGLYTKHLKEK